MSELRGFSLLGDRDGEAGGVEFHGFDPARGAPLEPPYHSARAGEVEAAVELAAAAAPALAQLDGRAKGGLLRAIAAELEASGVDLVERARLETALPPARLQSELLRTTAQLRLFAGLVEQGDWVEARIETADPARKPLPKPDHRSMLRALGPIAVFGASNFPLAFSVAGGDTASALAAGNPVLVKAHAAHPGTSELAGRCIRAALRAARLPAATFALLFDAGLEVGSALVQHPKVRAVGFTGSRAGGLALMELAARRPVPIPFYAEMSSVNPVFLLPGALAQRFGAIRDGFHASVTLGVGQFCTNPGIVVLLNDEVGRRFVREIGAKLGATAPAPMLSPAIHAGYQRAVRGRAEIAGVARVASAPPAGACLASPALFTTQARIFLDHPALEQEIFGPAALVVLCRDFDELLEVARGLGGNLTATVHAAAEELDLAGPLLEILEPRAGRLVFDGFPTGVEVSPAMVHGGPYPSTADGKSSSVGTRAIERFARPVCFQGFPDALLPPELQNANPLGIERLVNGERTRAAIRA
jgi:NADP-dependent aldehyde dehydrogenase